MSSSVESRVATMKFDNAQFKKAVSETLSLLGTLKGALSKFTGTSKPLNDISANAKKVDLSPIASQTNGISKSFIAMSTVAVTAISTLTSAAINSGAQMANKLTLAPIGEGLKEYETNLNSIQTIMANTGLEGQKGLGKVEAALNELNHYSDKTIYNFSEMARNIGTFTAAGIDLNTSTAAIKGIANLAAVSGSNSQQASTAMYQLSQALAAGKVSLMDWNSVVNAGMGGKVFRESLMETARVHGVAVDSMIEEAGSFRDSLQNGWISGDILTETLQKFTGDLSEEQLKQMGYTEKQIEGIVKMGKVATDAATKVKTMSALFNTLQETMTSGWAKTFSLIFGDFFEARELFTGANDFLGKIISDSAKARNKVLKDWSSMGGRDVFFEGVGNLFKALLAVIKPIKDAFRDIFPAKTGEDLFRITEAFRDFSEWLMISDKTADGLRSTFAGVFALLSIGIEVFKGIVRYIAEFVGLLLGGGDSVFQLTGSIGDMLVQLEKWLVDGGKISGFFDMVIEGREAVLKPIIEVLGVIIEKIADIVELGGEQFMAGLAYIAPYAQRAAEAVGEFVDKLKELAASGAEQAMDGIANALDRIGPVLAALGQAIKESFGDLKGSLSDIGPLFDGIGDTVKSAFGSITGAAGGFSLGGIFDLGGADVAAASGIERVGNTIERTASFGDNFAKVWERIVDIFNSVKSFLEPAIGAIGSFFSEVSSRVKGFVSDLSFEEGLAIINTGFFIILYKTMSSFFNKMGNLVDNVGGLLDQVTDNLKTMQADVRANIILKIAGALALLSVALLVLASIPADDLKKALAGVAALLVMLVGAIAALEKAASFTGSVQLTVLSAALVALGIAMVAFAAAVALFGTMDIGTIAKGLGSIAVILTLVTAMTAVIGKTGGGFSMVFVAGALLILAFSLTALAGAIKLYSAVDGDTILNGGLKIVAVLAALGLVMNLMPKGMLLQAAGLFIVANALVIMAGALKLFGNFSVEEIAKSLIVLGGALLIMAFGMTAMQGSLRGAAALLLVAFALGTLVPTLVILGNLPFEVILTALAALAGIFVVLAVGGLILGPVVSVLLALGAAIILLGIGAAAVGGGLLLFSAGLVALTASGAAGIATLTALIIGIAELFPLIMAQIGLGLAAFAKVVGEQAPAFAGALILLIKEGLRVVRETAPDWFRTVVVVLKNFLRAVISITPDLAKTLKVLIENGLKVIRDTIPDFIDTGIAILMAFLEGIEQAVPRIARTVADIIIAVIRALEREAPRIYNQAKETMGNMIEAMAGEIRAGAYRLLLSAISIGSAIIDGIRNGITSAAGAIADAAVNAAQNALSAVRNAIRINSPSKVFRDQVGKPISEGMAAGVKALGPSVADEAVSVGEMALNALKGSMASVYNEMSGSVDMDPVITPVLDLSRLTEEARGMGALLGTPTVGAEVSYSQASAISNELAQSRANATESVSTGTLVQLEQNIYSPKSISPVQSYRDGKSLIAVAKEALS